MSPTTGDDFRRWPSRWSATVRKSGSELARIHRAIRGGRSKYRRYIGGAARALDDVDQQGDRLQHLGGFGSA